MSTPTARIVYQGAGGVVSDARAIAAALAPGFAVETVAFAGADTPARVAVQLYIEHVFGAELWPAERSFLLVNHEYLHDWDMAAIADRRVTALCKTHVAMRAIADRFGDRAHAVYVGFGYLGPPLKRRAKIPGLVLHLAGGSPFKGTLGLIRAWIAQFDGAARSAQAGAVLLVSAKDVYGNNWLLDAYWASLGPVRATLAEMIRAGGPEPGADGPGAGPTLERVGSVYRCGFLSAELKDWLQSVAAVHACPSMVEGWGQYIDEGRRAGAVVVTLDAAPMNELVDADSGVLVRAIRGPPLRSLVVPGWTKYLPADYFPETHVPAPGALGAALAAALVPGADLGAAAMARAAAEAAAFRARLVAAVAAPAPAARTARLVHKSWGVKNKGTHVDCVIMRSVLLARGYADVDIVDVSAAPATFGWVDLQVFVEHVVDGEKYAARFPAGASYLLVNAEFLSDWDMKAIQGTVRALCKTRDAVEVLERRGIACRYVGFGNPIAAPAAAPKQPGLVLHMAGTSEFKNTLLLLRAWVDDVAARGEAGAPRPVLVVTLILNTGRIARKGDPRSLGSVVEYFHSLAPAPRPATLEVADVSSAAERWAGPAADVYLIQTYMEEGFKRQLQAAAAIHACPSLVEGWGQYIDEGRRAGAVVVTLDGPPMNELVDDASGVLVPAARGPSMHASDARFIPADYEPRTSVPASARALGDGVRRALALTADARAALGGAAARRSADDAAAFVRRFGELVA